MKTLYTGHVMIGTHEVYSFIYAETLLEAEVYLSELLSRYVRERHTATLNRELGIQVIPRPDGWNPPDGYYLPATSTQYALRYVMHQRPQMSQTASEQRQLDEASLPQAVPVPPPEEVLPQS